MASVNISLKREAYDRLASIKKPNESFSDEILRITQAKTGAGLLEFFGVWKDMSEDEQKQFDEGVRKSRIKSDIMANKWGK